MRKSAKDIFIYHAPQSTTCIYNIYDLRGKVNNFKVNSIGHCEKKIYTNMCLRPNDYQVRAV